MIDLTFQRSTDAGRAAEQPIGQASASASAARRQLSAHIEARLRDQQQVQAARPRVLHVDADPDSALLLATLIVPETELTHVHTLAGALRALGQGHYSLVVLDPQLADGDGVAVVDALRAAGAATPVLLYSEQEVPWAGQAGAFLRKPWASPRQLWGAATRMAGLRPPAPLA